MPAPRDNEGYLIEPDDWNETIATELAAEENIQLTDQHWLAIRFMRDYYAQHKIAPDVRHLIKHLESVLDGEKKELRNLVFSLFPYGYVKQACKISGMKRPRAWSTG
jgi:tRNA 2-thiouridine synthesizing protein E